MGVAVAAGERLTIAEVAGRSAVDRVTARRWITTGVAAGGKRIRLRATRNGHVWVVAAADLAAFQAAPTAAALGDG